MEWTTPELTDVNMSSEIGGYQDEFDPERDPRFGRPVFEEIIEHGDE
jgi:hypothetical protein